uniref:Ribosomal protein L26 n=1 Tax=Panagrolaimus sp. ES5 TaxID=591445 RepID=A0AC34GTY3_9BILA
MKTNPFVSSSSRKSRKRHFTAPSNIRRKILSAPLSKDLRAKYNVRSMPIRIGDEVQVARGQYKQTGGNVIKVFRKKFAIYIDGITRTKAKQQESVHVGIHPSNVYITKLKMNNDRRKLLHQKAETRKRILSNATKGSTDDGNDNDMEDDDDSNA